MDALFRIVMPGIFDRGNAILNNFVDELMDIRPDDRVLEIGCGTGKLVKLMADKIETGCIEGIDLTSEMVKVAQKKNKRQIANGIVNIVDINFDEYRVTTSRFTKICSINTIYSWKNPKETIVKVLRLLIPGGHFFVAFEDKDQLKKRNFNINALRFYSKMEMRSLLQDLGFTRGVRIETIEKKKVRFHCIVARRF